MAFAKPFTPGPTWVGAAPAPIAIGDEKRVQDNQKGGGGRMGRGNRIFLPPNANASISMGVPNRPIVTNGNAGAGAVFTPPAPMAYVPPGGGYGGQRGGYGGRQEMMGGGTEAGGPRAVDPITGMPLVRPGRIGNAPYATPLGLTADTWSKKFGGNGSIAPDYKMGQLSDLAPAVTFREKGGQLPDGVTVTGENGAEVTLKLGNKAWVIPAEKSKVFLQHAKEVMGRESQRLDPQTGRYRSGLFQGRTPQQAAMIIAQPYAHDPDYLARPNYSSADNAEGFKKQGYNHMADVSMSDDKERAQEVERTVREQVAQGRMSPEQGGAVLEALNSGASPEEAARFGSAFLGHDTGYGPGGNGGIIPDDIPASPSSNANPYIGNINAPSPRGLSPGGRYEDLSQRLKAIQQANFEAGKAAVQASKDEQNRPAEKPSGLVEDVTGKDGRTIVGKYGSGSTVPAAKDFPIVRADGSVGHYGNIEDWTKENAADQAQRHVEGYTAPADEAKRRAKIDAASGQMVITKSGKIINKDGRPMIESYGKPIVAPAAVETRGVQMNVPMPEIADIPAPASVVTSAPQASPTAAQETFKSGDPSTMTFTPTAQAPATVPVVTSAAPAKARAPLEPAVIVPGFKSEPLVVPGYAQDERGQWYKQEGQYRTYQNPTAEEFEKAKKPKAVPFFGPGNEIPDITGPMAKPK
jgi:hypothetical protein